MTAKELLELGIKKTYKSGRGHELTLAYEYKCASCGRPVKKLSLILDKPVYCNLCKTSAKSRIAAAKEKAKMQMIELESLNTEDVNKKQRFNKAEKTMQRIGGYDNAIQKAKTAYKKYGSVPEAIAAIILLKLGYKTIAQQKIGDYKADFVLPDKKVVIEIDGALYHKDKAKLSTRDDVIKYMLGDGWEIIHVPAEPLAKQPKAFERLIKKRIMLKDAKVGIIS